VRKNRCLPVPDRSRSSQWGRTWWRRRPRATATGSAIRGADECPRRHDHHGGDAEMGWRPLMVKGSWGAATLSSREHRPCGMVVRQPDGLAMSAAVGCPPREWAAQSCGAVRSGRHRRRQGCLPNELAVSCALGRPRRRYGMPVPRPRCRLPHTRISVGLDLIFLYSKVINGWDCNLDPKNRTDWINGWVHDPTRVGTPTSSWE
jgi:hypothetical protein